MTVFSSPVTDSVFNPAGILFSGRFIHTGGNKLFCEKSVALIYFFGNFPASLCQMKKPVFIHYKKSSIP